MGDKSFIILGGPSSVGKSKISRILKERFNLNYIHKRDANDKNILNYDLLETHYSFNNADKKYSQGISPLNSDFFSKTSPNLDIELFRNFDKDTFFSFISLYANPETIIERANKRFEESNRNPRSLDKSVIAFESKNEMEMCTKICFEFNTKFPTMIFSINANDSSPEKIAEKIYSEVFL